MANVTPLGCPHFGAGTVEILVQEKDGADYAILFSPDPMNNELRNAGLPMQFYYYPKVPRLAKHPDGRFKFSMQIFKGTADESTVIGAEGLEEEAGGFASLTSTIDIPEEILKKAIEKFQETLEKQHSKIYTGLKGLFALIVGKTKLSPANVRPIQLVENTIKMHVMGEDGKTPFGGANPWAHKIQGDGKGQTFGLGENAFSMLMGRYTVSLLKASLENGGNNLIVENYIKYRVYIPTLTIKTTVDAKKTHEYFSSNFSAGNLFKLNWEHEYEKLLTNGSIETEIICDESLAPEDMAKLKESLVTQQRSDAFSALQKTIFEPAEKEYTPTEKASNKKKFLFWTINCPALNLKSAYQERGLKFVDRVKYSGIHVFESKISGNMDPLVKKGEKETTKVLSQYMQEVRLDEDFSKLHVVAELNGDLAEKDSDGNIMYSPVSKISIEVGYPDSKGNMVWKGSGRMIPSDGSGTPYVTKTSRDGTKQIDAIYPAIWAKNEAAGNLFVFDFVRNSGNTKARVRQSIVYAKHKHIMLKDYKTEKEISGSKCFIDFPEVRMLDYQLSTEQLHACDTLEVTVKAEKIGSKKIKFTEDNCDAVIPYKAWYEKDHTLKPLQYKLKYTCKGKVGKSLKKVAITTDWETLDYTDGSVLFEIPSGKEEQNKTIEAIRKQFMEE